MADVPSNQSTNVIAGTGMTITFTENEGDYWDITFESASGSGHTIQDDDGAMETRANLSFQDGFVLSDDAGGDQTEVDLSYATTTEIADVAETESAGTSITVARGDHIHSGNIYRLESADHTHATTGLQAGQLDHGTALTGLTDDDHTQYRLESADHTHQSTGAQAGKLDHGLALDGLTDDDHTQYRKESDIVSSVTFSKEGTLTTGTGATRWYNDTGRTLTFASVRASVGTAPTGASLIVDVNIAGTTIYTTQASRPEIAISGFTDEGAAPDVTTIADNTYLTVDIDQVGSTIAGADLTVTIWLTG